MSYSKSEYIEAKFKEFNLFTKISKDEIDQLDEKPDWMTEGEFWWHKVSIYPTKTCRICEEDMKRFYANILDKKYRPKCVQSCFWFDWFQKIRDQCNL